MSAWSYCPTCGYGFRKPTPKEVMDGFRMCPSLHTADVHMTKDELIIELAERLDALEAKVKP